jgi:Holliday junction resolvasome RuvABC endonuclease subunit
MNVLALDLGLSTGWAMYLDSKHSTYAGKILPGGVTWGAWDNHDKIHAHKFLKFRDALGAVFESNPIEALAFEEVRRHAGTAAAHVYGGFVAVMLCVCADYKVAAHPVNVKVLKKSATGNGNAPKELMRNAANAFLVAQGKRPDYELDFNTADALCVLMYWLDTVSELDHADND